MPVKVAQPYIIAIMLVAFSNVAVAHHGFTAHFYPDQLIKIEGTVTKFDFINPHGFLHIETTNDDGSSQTFVCDLQANNNGIRTT